jgi:hypothetical protein
MRIYIYFYTRLCVGCRATSGAGTHYPSGAPAFTPGFSGVCVTRSLLLYVCFVDHCLSFYTFCFGHCVVCSSSVYEVLTTSGTYPWSFLTQVFHNGQPSHGGDGQSFEVMASTLPFILFVLAIVLSVLLRYTDDDYPLGISKPVILLLIIIQRLNGKEITLDIVVKY